MNKQLDEIESFCLNAMKNGDTRMVETYFGPYLSYKPRTQYTGLIKAYMILYYLSTDLRKMFHIVLETITPMELEDENIKLVMNVERYVNIGAVEKLKKVIENNSKKELDLFLKNIFENQKKSIGLSDSGNRKEELDINKNDRKNIDDAIFIGKNTVGF